MLKSIFVAFNRSPFAMAALENACFLAGLTHGKIHVGHVIEIMREPVLSSGMLAGTIETMAVIPPVESLQEVEQLRRESEAHAHVLFEQAHQVCQRWGVACETHCLSGYVEEEVALAAHAVDLVAIGQSGGEGSGRRIGPLTESIVRGSPQPVLLATAPHAPAGEIIVLYDGSARAFHALGAGAETARLSGLPLTLITAPTSREECETLNARACQYLGDYEVDFHSTTIAPHEGEVRELADLLNERPAALVMMGAFGESRLTQWLSGSLTRKVLERMRNPVVLFRH